MVWREFPDVRLIENSENLRFIVANNQAIRLAQGRYVLLVNSDAVILENAIAKTVRFADLHPEGAVFGCKVLNADMTLQGSCFMYPSPLNDLIAATYLNKLFQRNRFYGRQMMTWWDHTAVREVETISGCYSLVRRSAIAEVGLMDPIYHFFGDDIDWCYRFRRAGWSVYYYPDAKVVHYGGRSTTQMGTEFRLQLFGSGLVFCLLHQGKRALVFARMSIALNFLLRLPFWLIGAAVPNSRQRALFAAASTGIRGLVFTLFSWERLLMNRGEIHRRLTAVLGGRTERCTGSTTQRA